MGAYSKGGARIRGALIRGRLIPAKVFLPINYFFNATHTTKGMFLEDRQIFVNY